MKRTLLQCDSAPIPNQWKSEYRDDPLINIDRYGASRQVSLRLQELSDSLTGTLRGKAYDLVCIAAYIYVSDQLVGRGGAADIYGQGWRREIAMAIPVSDPDFWNSDVVRLSLENTVDFVSEDVWHFAFSATRVPDQFSLELNEKEVKYNPDSVILFSGGNDSLCAIVESVLENNLKPALVSHWSVPGMQTSQTDLVEKLRQKIPAWQFPHSKFEVNKVQTREKDTTQRTRSFLYASLGSAVADSIGTDKVILADNGVVSLNLPINDQLVGSLASRSTHPRFIEFFNLLSKQVLEHQPQICNPLSTRTRAECLQILCKHDLSDLLSITNSCAHRRNLSKSKPQCGLCSQCVDRRFASLAAGLERFDPLDRYEKDIFRDSLEGNGLTMVESFFRFARKIQSLSLEGVFLEYPQLGEAITLSDPTADSTMLNYTQMIKRHADSVIEVTDHQVKAASRDLVSGNLPPTCLISLAVQPSTITPRLPGFIHSKDYRSVTLDGQTYTFSPEQAEIVMMLDQARIEGKQAISWNEIAQSLCDRNRGLPTRMSDVFKKSPAWKTLVVESSRGMYRLNV